MFTPKDRKAVSQQLMSKAQLIELALVRQLEITVSMLVTHAVNSAGYEDQTGNLKSSIGGVVLKNGKPVTYKGFQPIKQGSEGTSTGLDFLNTIIHTQGTFTSGYGIIVVAGMSYATYVENHHGRNVLKASELLGIELVPKMLKEIKQRI